MKIFFIYIIMKYLDYGLAMTFVIWVLLLSSGGFGKVITFLSRKRLLCIQKEKIKLNEKKWQRKQHKEEKKNKVIQPTLH